MITRRQFVSAGLGLLAGSGFLYYLTSSTSLKNAALSGGLSFPADCVHARIGMAYLSQTNPPPTAASLHYLLSQRAGACETGAQKQKLARQLQAEYEKGQTAEVEGWVLPETLLMMNAYAVLTHVR